MTLSKPKLITLLIAIFIVGIMLGYLSTLPLFEECGITGCGQVNFWTWLKCHTIMYCD